MSERYGGEHQAIRRALAPYVPGSTCWRCGRPILGAWDLGHDDDNPGVYRGPEHARCNRAAGARKGNAMRRAEKARRRMQLTECALAVEVAETRHRTSIVACGWHGGFATVELAAYLSGVAGAVAAVVRLRAERTVSAVVVDPHSHASNLIKPLTDAGVPVTEPTTGDVAAAHGEFIDRAAAGALRHIGSPELDAAIRAVSARRLGGSSALDRRGGGDVDVAPAVGAELALWGLLYAPPATALVAWSDGTEQDTEGTEETEVMDRYRRPVPEAEQPTSAREQAMARLRTEDRQ